MVYRFASDTANLPRWAAGLAQSEITRDGDLLYADSPMGRFTVRSVPENEFGVLDHEATLPSGRDETTLDDPARWNVQAHRRAGV